ncbi:MAG: TIGR03943 family protein [Firmicutes bacterium]|nr:TIGR03943 family protein [Clostridia bacterium]MBQ8370373.1 TIGR03943 family protein [Clostridia bacterium]MBQ8589709.1 TIGR03943 family protein [Bacillota bacterium]
MEIPVYLFTGFLEAGKTSFIQETLSNQPLNEGGNTLLLVCEEGVEEYDPAAFSVPNVYCEVIEDESDFNEENLAALLQKHDARFVMIEYNGMWQLEMLYRNLPEGWFIYQELFICDSTTILNYNTNMRSLVVDKLTSCDLVAFNRVEADTDRMPLHKLVRGVSRTVRILYDMTDGTIEYDNIEDPLPFDINADIIRIEDRDYAWWYRDIAEDTAKYEGKKVHFKGVVIKDEGIPKGSFICGRHIMTCCADDIQYSGIACKWRNAESLKTYKWVEVTGRIVIEKHKVYEAPGPVIKVTSVIPASAPEDQVATFS